MVTSKKRVVVTGGAAGIGRAIAARFLAEGAHVAICDADRDAVEAFAREFPQAISATADVTSEQEMAVFLEDVETAWGGVDVVCANAGTGGPAGQLRHWTMTPGSAVLRPMCMGLS